MAPPPPFLPTSALSLELDALLSVTASLHAGFGERRATFECSFSEPGANLGFLLFAGLEPLLDALERLRMRPDELDWLEAQGAIDARTRKRLQDMRFLCDIDAAPEGGVVFPGEPVLTVEGPYWQAQLVSAFVLGALGSSTLAATKAARCVLAAGSSEVIESSSATAHRIGGNPLVARAAYVGSAHATTCAVAAKRFGIPLRGSLPWRFLQAAPDAKTAFDAWLRPGRVRPTLLLNHWDPRPAIAAAIVSLEAASRQTWQDEPIALEIGGGDRAEIAQMVVDMFRRAKLRLPHIFASGGLDEQKILELRRQTMVGKGGSIFSGFFVSSLHTDESLPLARYDLVAIEEDGQWAPRLWQGRSHVASGVPGRKVVLRYVDDRGAPVADVFHSPGERFQSPNDLRFVERTTGLPARVAGAQKSAPLLHNVMRAGKRVSAVPSAKEVRTVSLASIERLHERYRRLVDPQAYPVGVSATLAAQKDEMLLVARRAT